MPSVIVSVHDSPRWADAVVLAGVLARALDADVIAASVRHPEQRRGFGSQAAAAIEAVEAAEAVERAARVLAPDVNVQQRVLSGGDVAQALATLATDEGADAIVIGSHRGGEEGRTSAGRVAFGLLHIAPCAVAVAPTGYANAAPQLEAIAVGHNSGVEADAALLFAVRVAAGSGATLQVACRS
jgi:nucleotide-binding universal stress UspA family protein